MKIKYSNLEVGPSVLAMLVDLWTAVTVSYTTFGLDSFSSFH